MLLQQQEVELPWGERKEEMLMATIPVISVPEDEHIFDERPPPEGTEVAPEGPGQGNGPPDGHGPPDEAPPAVDNTLPPEETPA